MDDRRDGDGGQTEEQRGVAISTFGKVIKRGWDWLAMSPSAPELVGGVVEAPGLAAALTLNKGDFVRVGARGVVYLSYRKIIQEAVSRQLKAWGDAREPADEARRRMVHPLERDLERVLVDLSDEFPLLASLVERRAGGQKRLPIGRHGGAMDGQALVAAAVMQRTEEAEGEAGGPEQPEQPQVEEGPHGAGPECEPEPPPGGTLLPGTRGKPRPVRYGLTIRFEPAPEDSELGHLVESTVVVNDAHPAYRRAAASRSEGYHIALAVALALSRLAVEPAKEHEFVTTFLSHWGEALQRPEGRGRRAR